MPFDIPKLLVPASPESLLPELGETAMADLFTESRLGFLTVVRFWQDESQTQFEDALRAALKGLDPQDALSLVPDINALVERSADDSDCGHYEWLWAEPKDLQVDDKGMVTANVGHISLVAEVFEKSEVAYRFRDDLLEGSGFGSLQVPTPDSTDKDPQQDFVAERIEDEELRRERHK